MLWMDTWVHPYTDTPLKVGVDFWKIKGMTECEWCCNVMVEASKPHRLHPTHIHIIYIGYVLAPWYAVDGHVDAPLHWYASEGWRWGWIFGKLRVWLSVSVVVKSWLRLQIPIDCTPHPYYIYTMCLSILICCGWTCGCTLTLIRLWRWKGGGGFLGNWENDWVWVMSQSHGWGFKAP